MSDLGCGISSLVVKNYFKISKVTISSIYKLFTIVSWVVEIQVWWSKLIKDVRVQINIFRGQLKLCKVSQNHKDSENFSFLS